MIETVKKLGRAKIPENLNSKEGFMRALGLKNLEVRSFVCIRMH